MRSFILTRQLLFLPNPKNIAKSHSWIEFFLKRGRMEDRSVKRDQTEGGLVVSHLVRHLVSAQPLIIVSAEAGVSLINQDISVCLLFSYHPIYFTWQTQIKLNFSPAIAGQISS